MPVYATLKLDNIDHVINGKYKKYFSKIVFNKCNYFSKLDILNI